MEAFFKTALLVLVALYALYLGAFFVAGVAAFAAAFVI